MARSHGKILASIWQDRDFKALSAEAQRMYFVLLSQPKLSLVGVLDYQPVKWSKLASDTTPDSMHAAIDWLEDKRYVLIDRDTDELLIRTFVVHDLTRLNVNLVKGVWSAWKAVESPLLRLQIVHSLPEGVWKKDGAVPPPEAVQMCRSEPLEQDVATDRLNGSFEQAVGTSSLLSPVASHLSPPARLDGPFPDEVWSMYSQRALKRQGGVVNRVDAWRAATEARARDEHGERAAKLWAEFDINPSQLADVLLSKETPQWLNTVRRTA